MKYIACPIGAMIAISVLFSCGDLSTAEDARSSNSDGNRLRICLDGKWDFRMDPKQEGESGKWWAAEVQYPDAIQVPGTWQSQGFGPPIGIVKHNYQGHAWYRRNLSAPKGWQGRRVWLRFEGVCNNGDAYLNGQKVGHIETFVTPYEFDVTELVQFDRENTLCVMVDSGSTDAIQRSKVAPWAPESAAGYVGMMQFLGKWGGITSHVFLEARPDPAIDDVVLRPNLAAEEVRAEVRLKRRQAGPAWDGHATVRIVPINGEQAEHKAETAIAFKDQALESEPAVVAVKIPKLHPWSPDDPFRYRVFVDISASQGLQDSIALCTGFRELVVDANKGDFLLNGKPLFLRGVGYDSLEPITGSPLPDKQAYIERLRLVKQYGFNFVRLLGHTPLREFFEAADEVGVLVQAEGEWFAGWGLAMPPKTAEFLKSQVPRIIREHRNHPSWYAFSCFNEAVGANADPIKNGYIQSAYRSFREMDSSRLFLASDGGLDQWPTDVISDRSMMDKADGPATETPKPPEQVFHGLLDEVALYAQPISAEAMGKLAEADTDATAYQRKVAELQPIAYWQLEEHEPGVIRDSSGQGCEGKHDPAVNHAALGHPGKVGHALACGSTPETIPGLSMATHARKLVPKMQKSFSISLWAKPETFAINDYGTVFACGSAELDNALLVSMNGQGGDGRILLGRYLNNLPASTQSLRLGEWNHIGLTYDGRKIRLFINGKPDAEIVTTLPLAPVDLTLGRIVQRAGHSPDDYRSRPHVWHEFNNTYFGPLPDLEIEKRLTGTMTQAWVLEPHRRRMEAYGLLPRYPEIRKRSIELYREYVKWIFESARQLPRLDGYAWWGVIADIPGGVETDVSSLALLDMLYQPEKFVFDEFRKFNRESVLMIDADIDRRVLACGEGRSLRLSLSHFCEKPVQNGQLRWKITAGEKVLKEGVIQPINAEPGKITELGTIPLGPFDGPEPYEVQTHVELVSEACQQSNDWKFWVFPAKKPQLRSGGICNLTGEASLDARYGDSKATPLAKANLVLAKQLTPDILKYMEEGGRVIFLTQDPKHGAIHHAGTVGRIVPIEDAGFLRKPGAVSFWPLWIRCNANIVENHPALATFPHHGFADFQLMRLYGDTVPSVDFTPANSIARSKVNPIIWSLYLAACSEEATRFDTALTRHGLLSECRIEKGKAILCALYVLDGIRDGLPEASYFLDCLVDHALSDRFEPEVPSFSSEEARQFFRME